MKLIKVGLRVGLFRVLIDQNSGEIAADHEQRGWRLPWRAKGCGAMVDCLVETPLTRRYDAEGDTSLRAPHRRSFGSVDVGAGLDDFPWRFRLGAEPEKRCDL